MRAHGFTRSLVRASVIGFVIGFPGLVAPTSGVARAAKGDGLELPRLAPRAKLIQEVGLTEISIEYDAAAVRGRKIWGGLVPYDHPWAIGSNPAAKIRFSREVTIGDKVVPAGTYWLLATPGKTSWTFMINKSAAVATAADYNPDLDVARVKIPVKSAPHRERITFLFSDLTYDRAGLDLEWDNVRASLPIGLDTRQQIESAIGGLDNTWLEFANAARYMLETKKDYDAGLRYIEQSLALQALEHKQDWYSLWIKGALYAAKGDFVQAHDLAETAYGVAKQGGGSFDLEPDLRASIADWGKRRRPGDKEHAPPAVSHAGAPVDVAPPKTDLKADAKITDGQDVTFGPPSPPPTETRSDAATSPPSLADSPKLTDTAPTPLAKTAPVVDPPLRRARLRRR